MGELTILSYSGTETVTWDPADIGDAKAAEDRFNAMIEEGFSALKLDPGDEEGNKIDRFDGDAAKILMFPFLAGG
jgi:hypothetical protein